MRPLFVIMLLALPLPAIADSAAPSAASASGVCEGRALFSQCGYLGSPCCLGSRFYFDPRAHQLSTALDILNRIANRDQDEASRQLLRLREVGRLRSADALRPYPKLAALYGAASSLP
jgi:hypothetical protein